MRENLYKKYIFHNFLRFFLLILIKVMPIASLYPHHISANRQGANLAFQRLDVEKTFNLDVATAICSFGCAVRKAQASAALPPSHRVASDLFVSVCAQIIPNVVSRLLTLAGSEQDLCAVCKYFFRYLLSCRSPTYAVVTDGTALKK